MFRLFGFDVRVRTGFVLFTGLIIFIYQDAFGLWLAGSIAVLTLLHELGHAVAARWAGADASISLDFMAGYTSFEPKRPLLPREHAVISISGPLTQIGVSLAVLAALGVNPLSLDSVRESDASAAIWWAGPVIGLLNLLPVLPLDGGHLAQTGLESVLRRPALREMAIASVAITIAAAVAMGVTGNTGFVIFIAFLLIGQLQIVQATSGRRPTRPAPAAAWGSDPFMQGRPASPWQRAHQAIAAGDVDRAARSIVADLTADPHDGSDRARWMPPSDAPLDALAAIVDALPDELPPGNAFSQRILAEVLLATGHAKEGGEYAADGFARHRTPLLATIVARAAGRMGDTANAMQWVAAAVEVAAERSPEERALVAHVIDVAPELQLARAHPAFRATRAGLA